MYDVPGIPREAAVRSAKRRADRIEEKRLAAPACHWVFVTFYETEEEALKRMIASGRAKPTDRFFYYKWVAPDENYEGAAPDGERPDPAPVSRLYHQEARARDAERAVARVA